MQSRGRVCRLPFGWVSIYCLFRVIVFLVNPAKQRMFQCKGDEITMPVKTQFLGDR